MSHQSSTRSTNSKISHQSHASSQIPEVPVDNQHPHLTGASHQLRQLGSKLAKTHISGSSRTSGHSQAVPEISNPANVQSPSVTSGARHSQRSGTSRVSSAEQAPSQSPEHQPMPEPGGIASHSRVSSTHSQSTRASRIPPIQAPPQAHTPFQGPQSANTTAPSRFSSAQSQNSGASRMLSSQRDPPHVYISAQKAPSGTAASQSKVSTAHSQQSADSGMLPAKRVPSQLNVPHQTPQSAVIGSQSGVSSADSQRSGRSMLLPFQRAEPTASHSSHGTARSSTHTPSMPGARSDVSQQSNRIPFSRLPPSTINTADLPSTLAGSRVSSTRSGTRLGNSVPSSVSGIREGPAVTLCDCDGPLITEESYMHREAYLHVARHAIGFVPENEEALQNKLGLIRHCQSRGVSPADFGLDHWGVCHIESSSSIPNMRDWTVRAQLDHYIANCAKAEAEAGARDGHNFGALKRIAAKMGCIDHRHHLELDTIMQGGNPHTALEKLKECHSQRTGHTYQPGCCGPGAYMDASDAVVTVPGERSQAGSNRTPSMRGNSRGSSAHNGRRVSGRSAMSGSRGGSQVPSAVSATSARTVPNSVWNGGGAGTVVPSDSVTRLDAVRPSARPDGSKGVLILPGLRTS